MRHFFEENKNIILGGLLALVIVVALFIAIDRLWTAYEILSQSGEAESQEVLCCSDCGHAYESGDVYCAGCGQALLPTCSGCGAEVKEEDRFCSECGTQVKE